MLWGGYNIIASESLKGEDLICVIAMASGEIANQSLLYRLFINYMPDIEAKGLLTKLLEKMDILVDSTFGRTMMEMQDLLEQRERYHRLMDDIFTAYSSLTDYLEIKTGKTKGG